MMPRGRSETGSAFVISILVLFVLTVLGLAIMLSTTTESEISVNYRWGEMAFFNADAALEYGKNVLAAYVVRDGDFRNVLPAPRTAAEMLNVPAPPPGGADCGDPSQPGCRDHQYSLVRNNQLITIGRVLREPDTNRAVQYDFRQPSAGDTRGDIDQQNGIDIQGTVTLWVRRPIAGDRDYDGNDRIILTAEGTAPNYEGLGTGRRVAVRRLEMVLRMPSGDSVGGDEHADVTKGSDTQGMAAASGQTVSTVQ